MKIDLKCPVESRGITIKTSSKTNENYAIFKLYNLSTQKITEVELSAKTYDTYGKELGTVSVLLKDLDAEPKSFFAQNKAILLEEFKEAKHIVPEFVRVAFEDGSEYVPSGDMIDITLSEPDPDESNKLKEVAGTDAVCYAKDPGNYWICVCGRANENSNDVCVRCEREKKFVLDKFSSRQTVNEAYEEKKIADDRAELERYKSIERAKQERKEKILKNTIRGALGAICLAVLCVIGYFSYIFIATQVANVQVEKGNYLKAYKIYSSTGSSSIGKASEYVRGNSASNLFSSGILAEDEKNYYYINAAMEITVENKETGASKNTGIHGLNLNAVDGTLYFLSIDDSYKIYKLDANTLDAVPVAGAEEIMAFSLNVIGDDIYYVAAETVGEGQNAGQIPVLYKLKEGKTPQKVSDMPIQLFDVYKGKVYFISNDETMSLYELDKSGKEPKMVVEGPIYQFEIKDDFIYYIDYTTPTESADNLPVLSVNKTDLDGNFIGKLTGDAKAALFNIIGDKLYFIKYSDETTLCSVPLDGGDVTPVTDGTYNMFNASGDIALALDPQGDMVKINLKNGEKTSLNAQVQE